MKKFSRLTALLMALCLMLCGVACGSDPSTPTGVDPSDDPSVDVPLDPATATPEELLKALQKTMLEKALAARQNNSDTIGWLHLDGTTIDDAVVKTSYNDNNQYYLRRNAKGESDYYGCYYADWRCSSGSRDSLSKNTVIYGHSMSEDSDGVKFSQLKKYLRSDFAKAHPYIYFSTIEEDMIWEIFAVFYTDIQFDYINPNPAASAYTNLIEKAKSLSIYDYGIDVTGTDKILTLSTCTYQLSNGTKLSYPNNYRYVVMAKLVDAGTELKEEAALTVVEKNAPKDVNEPSLPAAEEAADPANSAA